MLTRAGTQAPERMNTLGGDLIPLINKYCLRADSDPDVLCVIMTGAGEQDLHSSARHR